MCRNPIIIYSQNSNKMLRKCCLVRDRDKQTSLKPTNMNTSKILPSNSKTLRSNSKRNTLNVSKSNANKNGVTEEKGQWKELLNEIGKVKEKIMQFTNDFSPNLTPKKSRKGRVSKGKGTRNTSVEIANSNFQYHTSNKIQGEFQPRDLKMSHKIPIIDYQQCNQREYSRVQDYGEYTPPRSARTQSSTNPIPANLGQINLVIDSKIHENSMNGNGNFQELNRRVRKLEETNSFLAHERVILERKLLFEEHQKQQLKKMLFDDQGTIAGRIHFEEEPREIYRIDMNREVTPKRIKGDASPIIKYHLQSSKVRKNEKSPYTVIREQLETSNYSPTKSRKLITVSNNSSQESIGKFPVRVNNQTLYYTRMKNEGQNQRDYYQEELNFSSVKTIGKGINQMSNFNCSRAEDFICSKDNSVTGESRKTSKYKILLQDTDEVNIHRAKEHATREKQSRNNSKASKSSTIKLPLEKKNNQQGSISKGGRFPEPVIIESNLQTSENPQFESRFSPRITFSRQVIPPRPKQIVSEEMLAINRKADRQKLKMLELYFERLIKFSRQERDKEKKGNIRKEMSQIATQIHCLRERIQEEQ